MEPPPPTYRVSGAAIRRTRMSKGLSIQDVAKSAGISRSYLQRLETGARQQVRPGTYAALRKALRTSPKDLLADNEDPPEKR